MANFCTQLQTKLDFAEQELLKAKDKENTMAIDLGRLESEVIAQSPIMTLSFTFPHPPSSVALRVVWPCFIQSPSSHSCAGSLHTGRCPSCYTICR